MPLTTATASKLRADTKTLAATLNDHNFNFSHLLYRTATETVRTDKAKAETPVYQSWGFVSWNDYVRRELAMSPQKANDYVRVWEVFGIKLSGHWPKSLVTTLGKMRILADYVTTQNVTALLKRAASHSEDELRSAIDPKRKGSAANFLTSICIRIDIDRGREIRGAGIEAKDILGVANQADALYALIMCGLKHKDELKKFTKRR
jgi:hypothetical protein